MEDFQLRTMQQDQWHEVAALIHDSMNHWYTKNTGSPIFSGPKTDALIFCEVYEQLDPNCCIVAVDPVTERIAGVCFVHPRETHIALGIMAVHSDYFGRGAASSILRRITADADIQGLPVRLVSSAMNLDSFSLYNRAGFIPRAVYQDMTVDVPDEGFTVDIPSGSTLRDATMDDLQAIVELEMKIVGIQREKDFRYILTNSRNSWHASVVENQQGRLVGFIASIFDTGRTMIGPGVMHTEEQAATLIKAELNHRRGKILSFLIPCDYPDLAKAMYAMGAKNCELSLFQCRGEWSPPSGIFIPTFMPETG